MADVTSSSFAPITPTNTDEFLFVRNPGAGGSDGRATVLTTLGDITETAEAEAGTETAITRWSPALVKAAIDALGAGGNVSGPTVGGSTDNAVARWNGTAGDTLQDSALIVSDGPTVAVTGATTYNGVVIENHSSRHESGGADELVIDTLGDPGPSASTALDVDTNRHGLCPRGSGVAGEYLDGNTLAWTALPPAGGPGSDTDAIHDNVAGEIEAIAPKSPPVGNDIVLIEDSETIGPQWAKKSATIADIVSLAPGGGPGSDTTAIHVDTANEIQGIAPKASPDSADVLVIEDSVGATWDKKRITVGSIGGGGGVTDHGALTGLADDDHTQYLLVDGTRDMSGDLGLGGNNIDNVTAILDSNGREVLGFSEVVNADHYVEIVNAAGAADPIIRVDGTNPNIDLNITSKGTGIVRVGVDFDVIGTIIQPTITDFSQATHDHEDAAGGGLLASAATPTAVHTDVGSEIAGLSEKVTPAGTDHLIIEDSADTNNKKRVLWSTLPGAGGGPTTPGTTTLNAIATWGDTAGGSLLDTEVTVSGGDTGRDDLSGVRDIDRVRHITFEGDASTPSPPTGADFVLYYDNSVPDPKLTGRGPSGFIRYEDSFNITDLPETVADQGAVDYFTFWDQSAGANRKTPANALPTSTAVAADLRKALFFAGPTVLEWNETTVPLSPQEGDAYHIGAGAGAPWDTHPNEIARYSSDLSAWEFYSDNGMRVAVASTSSADSGQRAQTTWQYDSQQDEWFAVGDLHVTFAHWTGRWSQAGNKVYRKSFTGAMEDLSGGGNTNIPHGEGPTGTGSMILADNHARAWGSIRANTGAVGVFTPQNFASIVVEHRVLQNSIQVYSGDNLSSYEYDIDFEWAAAP